ncbi:MAG: oligosaccharide flippase family protein [Bacteroidia bacterium]|nr:oligosaccharide flippase family protein [Bacteroidia bacterium]MCO5254459.1 oligosaccharide flippase family protein [Bacteroidota bacterium]MCZ2130011.1 oligosaccharide flippase family protein [Bacteroidia bacterium]
MSAIKKLAAQTLTYGLPNIVGRFINVLLVPLYTAYLSTAADYGIVTIVFTLASFLNVVYTHGMETAFFNFARTEIGDKKSFATTFNSVLITGLILTGIGFVFADSLAKVMDYENQTVIFRLLAGILFFDALAAIPFAWLRQQEKTKKYVLIRLVGIFLNIGLNLLLIPGFLWAYSQGYIGFDPQPHFISYIFWSNLVSSACIFLLLLPEVLKNRISIPKGLWRKMLAYALPLILVGLAGIVNETLDRILLKFLLPAGIADTEVGIYSAFYKISLVITLFIQSFRYAAEPFFFNHAKNENPQKTYAQVMDYFVWICGFILILTLVFLPLIAKILIRNKVYFEDGRGITIVPLLLLANLFLGVYYNLSIWYKLSNKTMMGGVIASLGACITILLNILLIPKLGFVGSAWATLGAYFGMTVISFIVGEKYYPVPYSYGKLAMNFVLLGAICLWFYVSPPGILFTILAALCYGGFFWWVERPDKNPTFAQLFRRK